MLFSYKNFSVTCFGVYRKGLRFVTWVENDVKCVLELHIVEKHGLQKNSLRSAVIRA